MTIPFLWPCDRRRRPHPWVRPIQVWWMVCLELALRFDHNVRLKRAPRPWLNSTYSRFAVLASCMACSPTLSAFLPGVSVSSCLVGYGRYWSNMLLPKVSFEIFSSSFAIYWLWSFRCECTVTSKNSKTSSSIKIAAAKRLSSTRPSQPRSNKSSNQGTADPVQWYSSCTMCSA